jgi:hypothetical protein
MKLREKNSHISVEVAEVKVAAKGAITKDPNNKHTSKRKTWAVVDTKTMAEAAEMTRETIADKVGNKVVTVVITAITTTLDQEIKEAMPRNLLKGSKLFRSPIVKWKRK